MVLDATGRTAKALAEPGPLTGPFVKKEMNRGGENGLRILKQR